HTFYSWCGLVALVINGHELFWWRGWDAGMLTFSISEFQERVIKTKERMAKAGVDILLVTDPANMNYLTGYDAWSFYVHQLLIILLDDQQPIWIGRDQDAGAALHTTWLDQDHIISYDDHYVQSTERHPMDFVCEVLKERKQD